MFDNLLATIKKSYEAFDIRSFRSINSFKTALACLIGYSLVKLNLMPQSQWIVVTILVVMSAQTTLGSMIIKSKMRFWGTVLGASASFITLYFFSSTPYALGIALFILTLICAYIASSKGDISVAGSLAAVTIAIIILPKHADMVNSLFRFIEICSGILIALLVTMYVFPIHASESLKILLRKNLKFLQAHFRYCLIDAVDNKQALRFTELDEDIIRNFEDQYKMIHNLSAEFGQQKKAALIYRQILRKQRKIFRGMNVINYCAHSIANADAELAKMPSFQLFIDQSLTTFDNAVKSIKQKDKALLTSPLLTTVQTMRDEAKLITDNRDSKEQAFLNTLLFSTEFFAKEMMHLIRLIKKIIH